MKRFTLRQLEYFIAVANHSSFTSAAEECFVTPGSIALAMNDLEKALGVQLLTRHTSKGVTLTNFGRLTLERARVILNEARGLQELSSRAEGILAGKLRIGCFPTMSPWIMPTLLEYFTQHHPEVDIDIIEGSSDKLQEMLIHSQVDVAFVFSSHLRSDVEGVTIRNVRLQALISKDEELGSKNSIQLSDLHGRRAVLLDIAPAADIVETILRGAGLSLKNAWRTSNFETVCATVARGLGFGILNDLPLALHAQARHHLTFLDIEDDLPRNALVAATPVGQSITEAAQETISVAQKLLSTDLKTLSD